MGDAPPTRRNRDSRTAPHAGRAQRDEYRALGRSCRAEVDVVHVATPDDVVRARLAERRGDHADGFVVDDDLLARYLAGFEAPGDDEDDVTVLRLNR